MHLDSHRWRYTASLAQSEYYGFYKTVVLKTVRCLAKPTTIVSYSLVFLIQCFFLTSRKRGPDLFLLKLKAWFVTHNYQHGKLGLCIACSTLVKTWCQIFRILRYFKNYTANLGLTAYKFHNVISSKALRFRDQGTTGWGTYLSWAWVMNNVISSKALI